MLRQRPFSSLNQSYVKWTRIANMITDLLVVIIVYGSSVVEEER